MKRKPEKHRVDLDLDFWIGVGAGIFANLAAQFIWEKWLKYKFIEKKQTVAGFLK